MSADLSTLLQITTRDPLQGREPPARRPAYAEDEDGRRFSDHLNEGTERLTDEPVAARERHVREHRDDSRRATDARAPAPGDDTPVNDNVQVAESRPRADDDGVDTPDPSPTAAEARDNEAAAPSDASMPQNTADAAQTKTATSTPSTVDAAAVQTQTTENKAASAAQTATVNPAMVEAVTKTATPARSEADPDRKAKAAKDVGGEQSAQPTRPSSNTAPLDLALKTSAGEATSVSLTPLAVESEADLLPDLITVSSQTAAQASAQFAGAGGKPATTTTATAGASNAGSHQTGGVQTTTLQSGAMTSGQDGPKGTLPTLNPTPDGAAAQIAAKAGPTANPVPTAPLGDSGSTLAQNTDPLGTSTSGTGARDTIGKLSTSGAQPQFRMASAGTPPTAQIAMQLSRAAADGQNRMSIQLQPAELGRVDVRLEVAADGKVMTIVAAERAETLELLQRDQRNLERALQDAGMNADAEGFTFLLDRGQDDGGQPFGEPGAGDGSGEDGDGPAGTEVPPSVQMVADGTLDIRI